MTTPHESARAATPSTAHTPEPGDAGSSAAPVATSAPQRRKSALDSRPSARGERNPSIPLHRPFSTRTDPVLCGVSMIIVPMVSTVVAADLLGELEDVGYAVVPDVLTADEVGAVRDALAPHFDLGYRGRNPFEGHQTQRVYCLVAESRAFDRLILDPLMLEVSQHVLGDNFLLTATLAIKLEPGEPPRTSTSTTPSTGCHGRIRRTRSARCGPSTSSPRRTAARCCTRGAIGGTTRCGGSTPAGGDRDDEAGLGARVLRHARARRRRQHQWR